MENPPLMDDFPLETSIYMGFPIAMSDYQVIKSTFRLILWTLGRFGLIESHFFAGFQGATSLTSALGALKRHQWQEGVALLEDHDQVHGGAVAVSATKGSLKANKNGYKWLFTSGLCFIVGYEWGYEWGHRWGYHSVNAVTIKLTQNLKVVKGYDCMASDYHESTE